MRMTMSPLSSALDAAEDGTMKMSSSALDADDEDDDESIILGAGCGRGRDDENMLIASAGDGFYVCRLATAFVGVGG